MQISPPPPPIFFHLLRICLNVDFTITHAKVVGSLQLHIGTFRNQDLLYDNIKEGGGMNQTFNFEVEKMLKSFRKVWCLIYFIFLAQNTWDVRGAGQSPEENIPTLSRLVWLFDTIYLNTLCVWFNYKMFNRSQKRILSGTTTVTKPIHIWMITWAN